MNNNSNIQTSKRPDRHGANNPMWQRHHTTQSREKMSQAATKRNQQYKKWKDSQQPMTMAEFLGENPSVKEYITHLVRQQIEEMIWREQKSK